MSKEARLCTLDNPDSGSDIPDMATPDERPIYAATILLNISHLGSSLSYSAIGNFRTHARLFIHSSGTASIWHFLMIYWETFCNGPRQNIRPCFRPASADAKCHASVKSMQIRKPGATEAGAASTCMRRPRSRPKRPSPAASQKPTRARRSGCRYL